MGGDLSDNHITPIPTDPLRDLLASLPIGELSLSTDTLRELHSAAKSAAARCREFVAEVEQAIIEHIEITGHDIDLGDGKRWYVGREKRTTTRPDSGLSVVEAILTANGGDLGAIAPGDAGLLAANPWKHGALQILLDAATYHRLFAVEYTADLKTGAQKRALKISDPEHNQRRISPPNTT